MAVRKTDNIPVQSAEDVSRLRQAVRAWAIDLNFSLVDQTKIVTAASELSRNMVLYAEGGTVRLEALNDGPRLGLRLTFEDRGPGIADVDMALKDGYTTSGGLGLGLGGAKRLSHEFSITSRVGEGTRVAITRWR